MSANNIIFIDRKNFKVYYQGTADNDDLGSLEGQGKTIEEAIDIAQKIIEECGEVEYGIKFISSRKYTEKHTKPTQPSSSKPDKSVQDKQTSIHSKQRCKQNGVFGIGGKIDRFFLSGDDITLYKINRFIRKLFLDILKHNKDDMTGLYDYDGIAEAVINLVKK